MIDMLVRLYDLPDSAELYRQVAAAGFILRGVRPFEKHLAADFAGKNFSPKWRSETEVACARQPATCNIATKDARIVGFACYDVTKRGFFGPTGVLEEFRGSGLGKALLMKSLEDLRYMGYAYAVIGGVGPQEFYAKACNAIPIEGSTPGIYTDLLKEN